MTEPKKTQKRKPPLGQSIGGVLFGFEQQVWRNQPPAHELVHHARPDDPVPAGDGGYVMLEMPGPAGGSAAPDPSEPEVRDLATQATVAVRVRRPMAEVDVGALVGRLLPVVGERIAAADLAIDGPPYVRYRDWGDETADLEIGFPVAGDPTALPALDDLADGEPGRARLPGGRCAVIVHRGPYPDLPASWGRLGTWMEDRSLQPAGPAWESYVDNPDLVDGADLRTEVIRPLQR